MASGNICKLSRRHDLPLYHPEIAGLSHQQGEDKHTAFTFQAGSLQMEQSTFVKLSKSGPWEQSLEWAVGRSPDLRATTCLPGLAGNGEDRDRQHLQLKVIGAGERMWCKEESLDFGVRKNCCFTSWLCDFGQIS